MVSVPCRGTTFLNREREALKTVKKEFPSPVGELHFSICVTVSSANVSTQRFPSPVGELYFSIPSLQSRHQSGLMVEIAWEKYFWKNK